MEHYRNPSPLPAVIALIVGLVIGYLIGTLTADSEMGTEIENTSDRARASLEENYEQSNGNGNTPQAGTSTETGTTTTSSGTVAFTIPVSSLSSEQQVMIRTMGIDGEDIEITNEMLVCAETEMGSERITAIRGGSEISIGEGIQLVGCYREGSDS